MSVSRFDFWVIAELEMPEVVTVISQYQDRVKLKLTSVSYVIRNHRLWLKLQDFSALIGIERRLLASRRHRYSNFTVRPSLSYQASKWAQLPTDSYLGLADSDGSGDGSNGGSNDEEPSTVADFIVELSCRTHNRTIYSKLKLIDMLVINQSVNQSVKQPVSQSQICLSLPSNHSVA